MSESAHHPEELLRRLEWTVIRRLDGLLQGDYRTLFRGAGLDLADLREYQYHDDVRHIDWNVTARLGTPYVREYHEDREVTAWFLLDVTASMDFGSRRRRKRSSSAGLVGVLARLLTRHGNRVGALLYDGRPEEPIAVIPPRSSRRHVLHILHRLRARPGREPPAATKLADLLRLAAQLVRRRALLFVVSDFISAPGWPRPSATSLSATTWWPCGSSIRWRPSSLTWGSSWSRTPRPASSSSWTRTTAAFRRRFAAAAVRRDAPSARPSPRPAWTPSSCRPATTWSRPSRGSPTFGSGAPG